MIDEKNTDCGSIDRGQQDAMGPHRVRDGYWWVRSYGSSRWDVVEVRQGYAYEPGDPDPVDVITEWGRHIGTAQSMECRSVAQAKLDAVMAEVESTATRYRRGSASDVLFFIGRIRAAVRNAEQESVCQAIHPVTCAPSLAKHAESEAERCERWARHADPRDAASLRGQTIQWRRAAASLRAMEEKSVGQGG